LTEIVKELKYLNKYLYKYRFRLILGIVFVILYNIFSIIIGPIIRNVIDLTATLSAGVGNNENFKASVIQYGLLLAGATLISGIFLYFQRQTIIGMSRYIEFDLKNEIYSHYQSLPLSFYRKNNTGDLMARISEDVSLVRMYLGPAIMYGLSLLAKFAVIIPIMLYVNVKLTLLVIIPLPILALSIYLVHSLIDKRSDEIQKQLSGLSTFIQEAFSGIRVIKAFAREEDSGRSFAGEANKYKHKSMQLTAVNSYFFPLILLLTGLSMVVIVYVGGRNVISGEITYGNIAEFIFYLSQLTWPVASLGYTTSMVQRAEASQRRINEFLHTKTDLISLKGIKKDIAGNIVFNNVDFVYPDSGIKALNNISFEVKEGTTLAIVGSTGSGKSTIANLACRLYDPSKGEILIDGIDIKDYDPGYLRSQIGYVPQDVFLFSDTIKNNIAFGAIEINEANILQAAQDADLYDNIKDFPNKFDTPLGERGITLSGGQKQRLSIARAIVREPKILILDDCLSAVDTKTENAILQNLEKVMKGRTSIIISHRVSSVKLADYILVVEDGSIVERGTHSALMSAGGVYKSLYQKQQTEGINVEL
jgi:ATP-binding cassette, subfamily B, multidrug efflux pump